MKILDYLFDLTQDFPVNFGAGHNKSIYTSDGKRIGSGIFYSATGSFSYGGRSYDVVRSDYSHFRYQLSLHGRRQDAYFD